LTYYDAEGEDTFAVFVPMHQQSQSAKATANRLFNLVAMPKKSSSNKIPSTAAIKQEG
jgi:hypothetical protein